MATTVRLLDDTLVDQIAAGEVIERPANLVKELLENALDAGATEITVSVEDGGRGQVRVRDDGCGMSREDAALSIERHATSKIASFEDLERVSTLGFRGEALPSIASVSRMTITTRPKADVEGTRLVVEGGALKGIDPVGCPPGTTIEVADLFYNVPARKKFLRARQTETSRIFEVCQRVALSRPALRLPVTSDGRRAREYLPARTLAERAHSMFGDQPLHELHAERDGVSLEAVLAPAELARAGPRHLHLLVNGRPIRDRALARAIAFSYGDRLPPGHYPRGVVSLQLSPEDVDVNAHPQKSEVRFRRGARLPDLVTRLLAARLPTATSTHAYWDSRIGAAGPTLASEPPARPAPSAPAQVAQPTSEYEPRPANGVRFVARLRNGLLVCETTNALFLIDPHRADALVRTTELRRAADAGRGARQHLLFPDRAELDAGAEETLERHGGFLQSLGFDISLLGERAYVIRSVPAALADASASALLEAALHALGQSSRDARQSALLALGETAALATSEPLSDEDVRRIVAALPANARERDPCVVGTMRMPSSAPGREHG